MSKVWLAPAKVNLFLHILSKRADGYHDLQTIFQLIDYCDTLFFEITKDGKILRTAGNESVNMADDLIIKAAYLLKKNTHTSLGVRVRVDKKIPIGAGLGGGSSDCATTLVALNDLWQTGLSRLQLAELSEDLGADVRVFIEGHSAWAEGIGNLLTQMILPPYWFLVIYPNKVMSSKKIFSHSALTSHKKLSKIISFYMLGKTGNDCLDPAFELLPELREVFAFLSSLDMQLDKPRMSGSGSAVFVMFAKQKDALDALEVCPGKWHKFVAQGINTSPLVV